MKPVDLARELSGNTYPGRGIIIGLSEDGSKAVTAYFIMGRSVNSRNRIFVTDGAGIRTEAFDPNLFPRGAARHLRRDDQWSSENDGRFRCRGA